MQLTDTHLVLLSAAAQRDDHLLARPATLRGQAADKLAGKLQAVGLIEVAAVTAAQPHWRIDPDGVPVGLRLLRAGFAAIGIDPDGEELQAAAETTQPSTEATPDEAPQRTSKRALVIAMLRREEGASVEAIMHATGWLPHSTRAALTMLRKAGHQLARSKDGAGQTIYRLNEMDVAPGSPADAAAAE